MSPVFFPALFDRAESLVALSVVGSTSSSSVKVVLDIVLIVHLETRLGNDGVVQSRSLVGEDFCASNVSVYILALERVVVGSFVSADALNSARTAALIHLSGPYR